MAREGLKTRGFADRAGIDKMTLNRLLNGKLRRLDVDLMRRISRATSGAIGEAQFAAFLGRLTRREPTRRARRAA